MRTITLKFASHCQKCRKPLEKGSSANWEQGAGVWCIKCEKAPISQMRLKLGSSKEALRKASVDQMTDAKKEWYLKEPDYRWGACATGELRKLMEVTPSNLF